MIRNDQELIVASCLAETRSRTVFVKLIKIAIEFLILDTLFHKVSPKKAVYKASICSGEGRGPLLELQGNEYFELFLRHQFPPVKVVAFGPLATPDLDL